jgi:DNA-binding NarL/FixJ family response regulator
MRAPYLKRTPMVKILLADDHDIIRNGLRIIIDHNIEASIIDEAIDVSTIIPKISHALYNLIILDDNMPRRNSLQLVAEILEVRPEAKIIMLAMHPEGLFAKAYLQLGVMGYLSIRSPEAEIKSAINTVLNHKKYVSATVLESVTNAEPSTYSNPFERLSKREVQILHHMLQGDTSKEISNLLDLDSSTVGTYKCRIHEKLGTKRLTDITSLARLYQFKG